MGTADTDSAFRLHPAATRPLRILFSMRNFWYVRIFEPVIRSLLAAGAHGYVVIDQIEAESLRATLSGIEAGEPVPSLIGGGVGDLRAGRAAPVTERSLQVLGSLADGLHDREIAILGALARGLSNEQIAKEFWVAQQTVKFHLTNIYRKLKVKSRTEAVRLAYEHQLIENPVLRETALTA